jgi:hypothetical protein
MASLGFAADGTELAAHIDLVSQVPPDTRLTFERRRAGGPWTPELVIDDAAGEPGSVTLAVAPGGAAVAAWPEITQPGSPDSPLRYRAAFRASDGTWGDPVTLAQPLKNASDDAGVAAAIAADGTAAAGAVVDEMSAWGELQDDTNVMVAVRPPGGPWGTAERISPYNVSATDLELAFDDAGQLTGAWAERYSEGATSSDSDDSTRITTRRRATSNGIWGAADDLTGSVGKVFRPLLAVGPDGRAVIGWQWTGLPDGSGDEWAATRGSASAGWSTPARVVDELSVQPLDAGVGPDGTTYLLYCDQDKVTSTYEAAVMRLPAGGAWSAPKTLRSNVKLGCFGKVAFIGPDAVLAVETADQADTWLLQASRWNAGAPEPEAPRDLENPGVDGVLGALISDRRGSVVAQWDEGFTRHRTAALDGGGPELTGSSVPASAVAGQPFSASASFADMWSAVAAAPKWDFGDGSAPVSGESVDHTYAQPGSYTVTVRSADTLANETTKTFTVAVTAAPPAGTPRPAGGGDETKPTVTLRPPRCRRHETKRACARRRHTLRAWRVLHGAAHDASPSSGIARVEIAITRVTSRGSGPIRFRSSSSMPT